MPTVLELLALLMDPPEGGAPETIYDDLSGAYSEEAAGHATAATDSQTALAAKDAEISRLKAANYDLMIAAQGGGTAGEDEGETGAPNGASEEIDAEAVGYDDLFEKEA